MKKFYKVFLIAVAVFIGLDSFSKDIQFLKPAGKKKLFSYEDFAKRRSRNEFNMGAQLFYNIYMGGSGLKMFGLGLVGEYGTENLAYRGAINYSFPKVEKFDVTANAYSSITVPSSITVTGKWKIGIISISADAKKIFGGNDYEDGGFYGALGAGLSIASIKTTLDSYDSANYDAYTTEGKETFSQLLIRGAIGYDARLDFGALYGEALLTLPANSYNSRDGYAGDVSIPGSIGIQAGIRIPLGG
jgi:hypothetical protein